jgi:flagellar protein FliJ
MRRFRFKLATVETYRKNLENDALRVLAEAQKGLQNAKNKKAELMKNLVDSLERREGLAAHSVTSTDYQLEEDFIKGTKHRIIQSEVAIRKAQKVVEKAMAGYLQARKQTRMMEVLREKAFEEFKKEQNKLEQKQLDDLYIMRSAIAREES